MKGAMLAVFGLIAASTFGDWIYDLWHGPLHLACHGQMVKTTQGIGREQTDTTLHVVIDFGKGTVAVENFGHYKIDYSGPKEPLNFLEGEFIKQGGSINRYTGTIGVWEVYSDWSATFDGLCKPAERIF